ncbi:MAG: SDR family NAD(P)-dependent oxidoreductase, partial [Sphingobacteriaceae bacterium]
MPSTQLVSCFPTYAYMRLFGRDNTHDVHMYSTLFNRQRVGVGVIFVLCYKRAGMLSVASGLLAKLHAQVKIEYHTCVCLLLMVTYRILVKYFFLYIKNLKLDKRRVIIYGAGQAGVAAKRTFDHDYKVNKNIIAFADDDYRKVGKTIDGVKIIDAKNLITLIESNQLDEIIFASYTIPLDLKNSIVDVCLENEVKVLNIPPHDVWPSGKLQPTQIQKVNIEDLLNRKPIQIDITAIQNELKGKRILITGAAGSIGSEIVRQLLKFETALIILCDQSETALHHMYLEIEDMHTSANFHAFVGDV